MSEKYSEADENQDQQQDNQEPLPEVDHNAHENKKPPSKNSAEEFFSKAGNNVKYINELLESLNAANVYINIPTNNTYFNGTVNTQGDVSVGSQYNGNVKFSSVKEVAGTIFSKDIEKIKSVYVKTNSYESAQGILNNKHILIIWGNPKLGKQTTAVHLLSSLEFVDIFEVDPTINELTSFQGEEKQAYIIDTLASESLTKINGNSLKRLSQKFKEKNSYLIITVDSSVHLHEESLNGFTVNWKDSPANSLLLEKHIAWYLKKTEPIDINQLLEKSEELQEILKQKLLPGEIDRLSELLAQSLNNQLTIEQAIASFSIYTIQKVKEWFANNQDLNQYLFMITLAVLNRSNYQIALDASIRLQEIVQPSSEQKKTSELETVFTKKRTQRVEEVCAHLTQGYENTDFGRSLIDIIELNNPQFQPAVLSYVWYEYDRLRSPLLAWLLELGSHQKFEIRIKAAAAAGELSKYSFDDVRKKLLLPWAKSQDEQLQKLAVFVLSVSIFDSNLAPQVLGLLHSWSCGVNFQLRWTAAAVYGSYVGLRFPDKALQDLWKIAKSGDIELLLAVANSILILFEFAKIRSDLYLTILTALQEWTNPVNNKVGDKEILLIFWLLMTESKISLYSADIDCHTLLWLAAADNIYEEIIIALIKRCLMTKLTRSPAAKAIGKWLKNVENNEELYKTMGRIIYQLFKQTNYNEREFLLDWLYRWSSVEKINSAGKILAVIKKYFIY